LGPTIRDVDHVIAASSAVKSALIRELSVSPNCVEVVNSFISPSAMAENDRSAKRAAVRGFLGIPDSSFLVGACGTHGWRKGSDVFAQVARVAETRADDVHFLWVGGTQGTRDWIELEHDLAHLGVADRVHLIADTSNIADYYCAMDVFALTSREDPFPLVVLEAANHLLPVVCFDGAGGAVEFVGSATGLSAPYLDVAAFYSLLDSLRRDASSRQRFGQEARRRLLHGFTIDVRAPDILATMQRCIGAARDSAKPFGRSHASSR
jgi:glycosyltransferase involved in cell wall biosynthesis